MKRWCVVPLTLRVGLILRVLIPVAYALDVVVFGEHVGTSSFARWVTFELAMRGWYFVAQALVLFGALELSRLLVGRAARGARIAAIAGSILLVAELAMAVWELDPDWSRSTVAAYVSWGWFAVAAIAGMGFAFAACRRPVVAALVGVATMVLQRPPVLVTWLDQTFADSLRTLECVISGIEIAAALVLGGLVLVAVADLRAELSIPVPQRAREGLGWVARSLWLRLAGVLVVPLVMLMLSSHGHGDPRSMMAKAAVVASFISIVSFTVFGLGALDVARSQHAEVRRWPFLIAAAASLWSAGVMLGQVAEAYRAATTPRSEYFESPTHAFATSLTVVVPLVAIAASIALALAISGFAKRRGNVELATRGQSTAILVGTLQVGALVVANMLIPAAPSEAALGMVILGGVVAGIIVLAKVANLAADARELVDEQPPAIPVARIV
jgi:hypothetical protein